MALRSASPTTAISTRLSRACVLSLEGAIGAPVLVQRSMRSNASTRCPPRTSVIGSCAALGVGRRANVRLRLPSARAAARPCSGRSERSPASPPTSCSSGKSRTRRSRALQFAGGPCATVTVTHAAHRVAGCAPYLWHRRIAARHDALNAGDLLVVGNGTEPARGAPAAPGNLHQPLVEDFVHGSSREARAPAVDGDAGRAVAEIEARIYQTPAVALIQLIQSLATGHGHRHDETR